jgi:SAM-dependent methyltransferase
MEPWFDRSFGPWYPKLYPHRDLTEARRAVALVLPRLPAAGRLLDLGCGAGRHLQALREAGRDAYGLDRSWTLLREAGGRADLATRLVRGDMRFVPAGNGTFSGVLSMFTTFGYFGGADAHVQLLAEIARVTSGNGRFVLDYLNAAAVRARLVPESRRLVDGHTVHERRFITAGTGEESVVKETTILGADGTERERFREEVVLYDREQLLDLLDRGGWRPRAGFGDYDGRPWRPAAPRCIVIAEKSRA